MAKPTEARSASPATRSSGRTSRRLVPPGALRPDDLQRLPQCARLHRAGDADQAHAEPDLLQLPRREARPAAVGTPAGDRRLLAVPYRHGSVRPALLNKSPPLLCQQCHSSAGHPSVARTSLAAGRHARRLGLRGRRQLHQLPHPGARIQPPLGRQADAMSEAGPPHETGSIMRPFSPLFLLAALGALRRPATRRPRSTPRNGRARPAPSQERRHRLVDVGVGYRATTRRPSATTPACE